jgi:hypothetical protein
MFAIADERDDGRSYWWCGGLIWLANVDEAAKFETYEYARHTIELIRKATGDRFPALRVEELA